MQWQQAARKRFIAWIAALLPVICALGNAMAAQSVAVQFIDGHSGKPIGQDKRVYVAFQQGPIRTILNLHTDRDGLVSFDVEGAKTFRVAAYGYASCGEQAVDAPLKEYPVDEVREDGLLTDNDCSGTLTRTRPTPGRLLYYVKRESRWDSFKKSPD